MAEPNDGEWIRLDSDDPRIPYHLRPGAPPLAVCDRCGRQTWSRGEVGTVDQMTQPNGRPCGGLFRRPAPPRAGTAGRGSGTEPRPPGRGPRMSRTLATLTASDVGSTVAITQPWRAPLTGHTTHRGVLTKVEHGVTWEPGWSWVRLEERPMPLRSDCPVEIVGPTGTLEVEIHVCLPSLGEPCGRPCHRCVITDHEFRPVDGHPDDDECTFGGLAFYCGRPRAQHDITAGPNPYRREAGDPR